MLKKFILTVVLLLTILGAALYYYVYFIIPESTAKKEAQFTSLESEYLDSYKYADTEGAVKAGKKMVAEGFGEEAAINLAEAYLNQGSLTFTERTSAPKALELLEPLLAKYPDNTTIIIAVGYANETLGNYDKAIGHYNHAIALDAENDLAYVNRGHAYDLMGKLDLAEKDYLKAYALNPDLDVTLSNLARHYYRAGDFDLADEYAQKAIDTTDLDYVRAVAADVVAGIYIDEEEYQNAIDYLNFAIDNDPKDPTAYEQRGYATLMLYADNTDQVKVAAAIASARKDANFALSLHKESSFATTVLGIAYLMEKNTSKAKEEFSKALDLVDKDITLGLVEKDYMKEKLNPLLK